MLAEQDYDARKSSSRRFREAGTAFSRPIETTNSNTEPVVDLKQVSSPEFDLRTLGEDDEETFLGLHQLYNPEAETSVLPPTVLSLGPDDDAVKAVVQRAYGRTSQLPSLSFEHYWVLECRTHHSVPIESWNVFPDYIPTAEV